LALRTATVSCSAILGSPSCPRTRRTSRLENQKRGSYHSFAVHPLSKRHGIRAALRPRQDFVPRTCRSYDRLRRRMRFFVPR
jgi:hypothetical protein